MMIATKNVEIAVPNLHGIFTGIVFSTLLLKEDEFLSWEVEALWDKCLTENETYILYVYNARR